LGLGRSGMDYPAVGTCTPKGVVIRNPGIRITGYDPHVELRILQRAVTKPEIEEIVSRGVTLEQSDAYYFMSREIGVAVTSKAGYVLTAYRVADFYPETWALLEMLGLLCRRILPQE